VRGRSPNQKEGNDDRSKLRSQFDNSNLTRDQCTFCKLARYWKKDSSELKKKNKLKENLRKPSEVNVARSDENYFDSSTFSLSITPSTCYSDVSEWLLDTGATYHICPRRK